MLFHLKNKNSLEVRVNATLYSSQVIFKCLYWYSENFVCEVLQDGDSWVVEIVLKEGDFDDNSIQKLISKFKQDLIDFKTREIITEETKNIRDILLVKAFAHSDEFDELPTGDIQDPVGFDPRKF
jgi:His-Xaa-Ser system protein HxsD